MSLYSKMVLRLEVKNSEIWNYFMEGIFIVQISDIPGIAIGCDHAGQLVNREDKKKRGGLKGIIKSQNSRNQYYLHFDLLI